MSKNKNFFENIVSKTKIYLVIIAILMIMLCIMNTQYIIPSIILYILIFIYSYWTNIKRKNEISKHIEEITFNIDSAAKNTLINSPFPLVILETDGTVIWRSSKFISEFESTDINNTLLDLAKELKNNIKQRNNKRDKHIQTKININKKTYKIVGNFSKSKNRKKQNEYMMTLYFIDYTEYEKISKKLEGSKTCIGIVKVDNYEEMMQRISNERRPQVLAEIDKSIYDWASISNGIIIKTERETYVYVFEQKSLKDITENKFDILDTVKEIETEAPIQVTLSIAVSNEGKNEYEKYKSALAAMDIILGRGGDQAVIRENGKYNFFGGRTQEVEKRTKVKARIVAHALEGLIEEANQIMIMGHTNSDIDSIGSSLGIYRIAKTLKKPSYIVNDRIGATLDTFAKEIEKDEEYKNVFIDKSEAISRINKETLLVVVDTHKKTYVEVPELLDQTDKIVFIDHHRRSTDYIDNAILAFHEVYASSAAELVTELIQYTENEVELSKIEAEALYGGIMVDTKNFTFKTGVRTFEAAAYLRKCGIDILKIKKWFQSDFESYNIITDIVRDSKIIKGKIGISMYNEENKDAGLICAKAADELLTINDITASFVIGNLGNKICISGRSIGEINVQLILEKLGGGGHITLAGAQIEGKTQEEVKEDLLKAIDEYFDESVN